MAAGTMWNSAFVKLFSIKHRLVGVVPIICGGFLYVVLSDAAKDLFLVANRMAGDQKTSL